MSEGTEVVIRFVTPEGFPGDLRFRESDGNEAMKRLTIVSGWLAEHGYQGETLRPVMPNGEAAPVGKKCPECGQVMEHKSGVNKNNKPYSGWFCPNRDHKPVWDS